MSRSRFGNVIHAEGTSSYEACSESRRDYEKVRKPHYRRKMKNVQAGYRKQQALSDIASQLDQAKICSEAEDEARTDTITDHLSDERRAVQVVPFPQPFFDVNEERQRRSEAINAVIALSKRQEPGASTSGQRKQTTLPLANDETISCDPMSTWPLGCCPTQCIFCLGNTTLTHDPRRKVFRNVYSPRDHFVRLRLGHLPDNGPVVCTHPECLVVVQHKQHLCKHALELYNTRT
jgi:hypothetical protein